MLFNGLIYRYKQNMLKIFYAKKMPKTIRMKVRDQELCRTAKIIGKS